MILEMGQRMGLRKTKNLDIIFGEASFTGNKELKILLTNGRKQNIAAKKIFINAGCRPTVPVIEGLDLVPFLNSTSIMELRKMCPNI